MSVNTKFCLVCAKNRGRPRKKETIYHNIDKSNGSIWVWCCACNRGWSINEYCYLSGVSLQDYLRNDFDFVEGKDNEVQKLDWPAWFVHLEDIRAKEGLSYVIQRGLEPKGPVFYDTDHGGIVFPYYFENVFCGAQIRLLRPWKDKDGGETKIFSLPGTKRSLLFYNWNQTPLMQHIKAIVVTEGAFNALSLQQAAEYVYGGVLTCPFKFIAISGSAISDHHIEVLKEYKDRGIKIIFATDNDEAGLKALKKAKESGCATHYSLVEEVGKDWNDKLIQLGKGQLMNHFLGLIKKI
jgi:DNA primase